MSAAKEEALSPDELRKRLYQTFKNKGVLDTLKTQLRNQLIQELKHPVLSGGGTVPRLVSVKTDSLLVSASNSLVAGHLQTSGYEYTLSVFHPECGLAKDKVFTTEDLLLLLKICPHSPLYRSLTSNKQKDKKGFLISFLTELTDYYIHGQRCDVDTQTTNTTSYRESLVDKMKMIDQEYESHHRGDKWVSYETKLAAYRKDIEAQVQAEMNAKMQHFKDVELAKVTMEERVKSHREFENLRRAMERTHELKVEALIKREKNAIERLQKQQEIEEKSVYMQRQSLLKEIETVRNREHELKFRMEAFEKTCKIHEEKVKSTEELCRRRELAVKTMEDTYDHKLQNELSRYKLELKEEFIKRTEKLTENENRNKVETARIQQEAAVIDAQIEEHSKACSDLRRLQIELDTSQQQASLLSQQRELLRERLEAMSDYPGLRREKEELQGQLRLLKTQLGEAQEENRLLRADLGKPSKEQLALQTELRRLQSARRSDEEEFDGHRQVLQARLQSEVERCAQFKAHLVDCEEKVQWMTTYTEDIKTQLRQTQLALENEVLRNPKPSLVDRSVLELSSDKLVPPDIYVDKALFRARAGYDDVCEAGGPSRGGGGRRSHWARSSSPDSDTDVLAGAKARIRELEKEAETLEEAYRNYQQRAVHATLSHMLPPRPLSPPQRAYPSSHRPHSPQRQKISHRSRPHSPQQPHRPLSPQRQHITHHARTTSPGPHQNRSTSPSPYQNTTTSPTPQPRVTFPERQAQRDLPSPVRDDGLQTSAASEALFTGDGRPQNGSSSPSRHLPSTTLSLSGRRLQTELVEEAVASPSPELSPGRMLSPVPRSEVASSVDFPSDLSPPRSPQLKSTVRDHCSPLKVQQVFSSLESSPEPEKIHLVDLTETPPEPSYIPELLLDTAVPLSEKAPDGPSVPALQAPHDLPDTQRHTQAQGDVHQTPDEAARPEDEEEEDEEQRWERDRKERQERRQREQEEARERELRELERLERESLLQEAEQAGQGEKEEKGGDEEQKEEEEEMVGAKPAEENPLEKYMKMVLEARQTQQVQSPVKEEPEHSSPEARSLSEEKDDSIAVYSQEAVDDDFW